MYHINFRLWGLFLSCLLSVALTANILILSPALLQEKFPDSSLEYTSADLGINPYGQTLKGKLMLAEPFNACDKMSNNNKYYMNEDLGFFILASAGRCPLSTKARNAENIGASLLIIMNDESEGVSSDDDIDNNDIQIPSLLIKKEDGEKLFNALESEDPFLSEDIVLSVSFSIVEQPSDNVRIDFFFEPQKQDLRKTFFQNFNKTYNNLKENLEFIPHYVFQACDYCEEDESMSSVLMNDCVSNGRYCLVPPPDDKTSTTGKDIIIQSLRELCIYQNFDGKWWEYQLLYAACNQTCSADEIYNKLGLSKDEIEDCVNNSFEGENPALDDNSLLREQKAQLTSFSINTFPSLLINQQTVYKGNIYATTALSSAICSAYNVEPDYCSEEVFPTNHKERNILLIILVLAIVIGGVIGGLYLQRRKWKQSQSKGVNIQLDQMVSQYFAIGDEEMRKSKRKRPNPIQT